MSIWRRSLSSTGLVYIALAVLLAVSVALYALRGKNFFELGNVTAALTLMSLLGLVAIGQTLVVLAGSLDLSVPYVFSLASLIGGIVMGGNSGSLATGLLAALGVSAFIGLINGLIVTGLGVHGFVATLGSGLMLAGFVASNFQGSAGRAPAEWQQVGITLIGPVPVPVVIMLGCAGVVAVWLRRTRIGLHLVAVGGDRDISRMSGVRVNTPVVVAHMLCSTLAGLAGLILLARTGVGSPTSGQQGTYDLMSIAAVVLGGTLLAGGRGSIAGTIGGVAIFAVLDNSMSGLDVNSFIQNIVRGLVIVIAVAVYARRAIPRRPTRFSTRTVAEVGS